MTQPFLSIIVATFNAEGELATCLASIARQTMPDVEVLISDGGSSDETVAVAHRHVPLVQHVRSGPDAGIYDAWNRVIGTARGTWVLFLGADDALITDDALAGARARIEADQVRAGLVAFPCWVTGRRERMLFRSAEGARRALQRGEMGVAHTSLLHHRTLFETHGHFDASYTIAGDLDFLLRTREAPLHAYPSPVLTMMGGDGVSNDRRHIRTRHREAMRARERHGLRRASLKQRYGMLLDYVRAWEDARRD